MNEKIIREEVNQLTEGDVIEVTRRPYRGDTFIISRTEIYYYRGFREEVCFFVDREGQRIFGPVVDVSDGRIEFRYSFPRGKTGFEYNGPIQIPLEQILSIRKV